MLFLLMACTLPELPFAPEQSCADRGAWYPDEDGNGVGEPSSVYIGCSPPEGWVQTLGMPTDTGAPTDSDVGDSDLDTDPVP